LRANGGGGVGVVIAATKHSADNHSCNILETSNKNKNNNNNSNSNNNNDDSDTSSFSLVPQMCWTPPQPLSGHTSQGQDDAKRSRPPTTTAAAATTTTPQDSKPNYIARVYNVHQSPTTAMSDYFDDDPIVNAVPVDKREIAVKAQYKCVLILTAIIILISITIVIVSILIVTQSSSSKSSLSPSNHKYNNDTGKIIGKHPKAPKEGGGGVKKNKGGIRKHSLHCPPDCYNNHFQQAQAVAVVCSCDCYITLNQDYYESCIDQHGDTYYPPNTSIHPIIMPINNEMDSVIDSNIINDDEVMTMNNNPITFEGCPLLCYDDDEEEGGIDNWTPRDCSVFCYRHKVQFKRRFRKYIERKGGDYTSFFTVDDSNNAINTTVFYIAPNENNGGAGDGAVGKGPGCDSIQYDDNVNVGNCAKYCYRINIHRDWDPSICNDSCYETLGKYMTRYVHWVQ